ncbi:hypothetical protein [Pseudodesulfovibrio profundus]|uniref:hypothetical protein n=1 Tax=Pseudodesulfovibrio profundus TaxID=57320 RepID=UPI0012FF79AA|nr:hypothetical protein [Pseudodesulfovibrio profundus]
MLAVNCAYYTYDDEGFWKHFCNKLNCNSSMQSDLGEAIEAYMEKIDTNFQPRVGTNRYVGRIMEQCGISRYFLKDFVWFIKHLKQRAKWDATAELQFDDYELCVPEDLPLWLGKFLRDKGGWTFTTSVAKNMSQLNRGLLTHEQLASLPSYRPSFWSDFFKVYGGHSILPPRPSSDEGQIHPTPLFAPPSMRWESPLKCPDHIVTEYVGTLPLPKLIIENPQSIISMEYLLIYDAGQGPRSIQATTLEKLSDYHSSLDLNKLGLGFPCRLRLWFEATGRTVISGGQRVMNELVVNIVDDLSITASSNLVAPEDHLPICLNAPKDYTLSFSTEATHVTDSPNTWVASCRTTPAQGFLKNGSFSLQFSIPIYRDILRLEDDTGTLLKSELDGGQFIYLEGSPGSDLALEIRNDEDKSTIFSGGRFGKDGTLKVNSRSLAQGLYNWAGPWGIVTQGTGSPSGGLLFLDLLTFLETFPEPNQYPEQFFKALPTGSRTSLKEFSKVLRGEGTTSFDVNDIQAFPTKLQTAIWILAACSVAFDDTAIEGVDCDDSEQPIPPKTRFAIQWYRQAKSILTNGDMDAIENLLNGKPDFVAVCSPRWKTILEDEIGRLEDLKHMDADLSEAINEWSFHVTAPLPGTTGMIACLPKGQELISAWRKHYKKLAKPEIPYAEAKKCSGEPGLVGDLAKLLQLAILKNTDRQNLMAPIDATNMSPGLQTYANALKNNEELPTELEGLKRLLEGQHISAEE